MYVTNNIDDTVSVIDTTSDTVVATPAVGAAPWGVALNPTTPTAYVTNEDDGTVSVIDTTSNTVTATVTVGDSPLGVAVNPAGTSVYVANNDDDTVSVIDTASNDVVATIAVGASPLGVAVNSAGTRVYVTNNDDDTLSVIDSGTNTVADTFATGSEPSGVAVDPAGTWVYVSNNGDDTISIVDASSGSVAATVPVGDAPEGVALNPSGTRVYVANTDDDTVSVIDTSSATVIDTVAVGDGPIAFGQFIVPPPPSTMTPTATNTPSPSPTQTPTGTPTQTPTYTSGGGAVSPTPTWTAPEFTPSPTATESPIPPTFSCSAPGQGYCITGGGPQRNDCLAEWYVAGAPLQVRSNVITVDCRSGDSCDADGVAGDGSCTFWLAICLNNNDPRLACNVSGIASYQVQNVKPKGVGSDGADSANVASILGALAALPGANLSGQTVIFAPPITAADTCTPLFDIVVPLQVNAHGRLYRGTRKFKTVAAGPRAGSKVARPTDIDALILRCRRPEPAADNIRDDTTASLSPTSVKVRHNTGGFFVRTRQHGDSRRACRHCRVRPWQATRIARPRSSPAGGALASTLPLGSTSCGRPATRSCWNMWQTKDIGSPSGSFTAASIAPR